MGSRLLSLGAATLVAGLGLLATAAPALAAKPVSGSKTTTPTGYDISYPQCRKPFPSSVSFGIVGVNDGIVYSPNPCVAAELSWAEGAANGAPAFYANTADPGPAYSSYWPAGQTVPQTCLKTDPNSTGCSYDYGWNAATDSFADAVNAETADLAAAPSAAAANAPWWLDVETANSWESLESAYGATTASYANDTSAIEGEMAYLSSEGVTKMGIYSTGSQWNSITGGTGTTFANTPAWLAGYSSLSGAESGCTSTSFTGGKVTLTQYPSGKFDADYPCP